ncbi:hypothetical protein [Sinimarinibacterium sp. NLF-5-8]|uniref:hypothetical protein n=1 Tax=Sinimarinibacterium sp. NLF-5-8 TaxID=2698684 RepID=UPI00137BE887|nr:hypothetical protein [Sinimarinibacterium sp. NLF-5-8]QHS10110.1 hypothetical protein GT972_08125 [Sinimarinibacterium sp. NLF-5-8]
MFAPILIASLRILGFRAGPQDFPFDERLTTPLVAFAVMANSVIFVQVLPLATSLAMAAAMVAATALMTRSILNARQLGARFTQTFHALLATSALLMLMLAPLFAQMVPVLREVQADPSLLEHPESLKMPQGVAFLMNLINFWSFVVTAHIFRHAANIRMWGALLVALLVAVVSLFAVMFAGSIAGMVFGVGVDAAATAPQL